MQRLLRLLSMACSGLGLVLITVVVDAPRAQEAAVATAAVGVGRHTAAGVVAEVERIGTGDRTLILLPCMSGRWRSFETFMERNRGRYTMYAVTFPGYGGTLPPDLPSNTRGETPWHDNAVAAIAELYERYAIEEAAIVGHSWGTVIGVQFAAANPNRVSHLINLDGFLHNTAEEEGRSPAERLRAADKVVAHYSAEFADADKWARFNGSGLADPARRALHHGMFMATDKRALLQYWRENVLVEVNRCLRAVECPILDLHAVAARGEPAVEQARARRRELAAIDAPDQVTSVAWFGARHFVHEILPARVDSAIAAFLDGGEVVDDVARHLRPRDPNADDAAGGQRGTDSKERTFRAWNQNEDRGSTRLIYFHETVNPRRPWDSSPGSVTIEYGKLAWRPELKERLERMPFRRWRLGKNHWTNLDSRMPLVVGGQSIAAGYYYLFLERAPDGATWSLLCMDPARVAAADIDAWHLNRREIPGSIRVPLAWEEVTEPAPALDIRLPLQDGAGRRANLEIRFGPYLLTAPVEIEL